MDCLSQQLASHHYFVRGEIKYQITQTELRNIILNTKMDKFKKIFKSSEIYFIKDGNKNVKKFLDILCSYLRSRIGIRALILSKIFYLKGICRMLDEASSTKICGAD